MAGEWLISGTSVTEYSAFLGYQYTKSAGVPEKAVEEGGFYTANKWETSYRVRVQLAKDGTPQAIGEFLEELERLLASTALVTVITPSRVYIDATVFGLDYDWSSENGARLCIADVSLQEVRPPVRTISSGGFSGGGATTINNAVYGECNSSVSCGRLQGEQASPAGMVQQ